MDKVVKYYQFDEDVLAVRSVIVEAENKEEAEEVFRTVDDEHFSYETYETLEYRISEHLFKPQLL